MARKLARPTPSPPTPPSDALPDAPAGLVRLGLHALEDYDYELARTHLTRAFELSGGAEAAARALLTLLIDHLAADQEALALGDRLSREALASPSIRLALALAAARCGDSQRARVHLARLDGVATADVLVALAERAAASGEVDEAARLCDEARVHDGAHAGVRQVARRLAQAREEERRPAEQEIELFLAEGLLDEARLLAEDLLARYPESAVARRVMRAALDRQRADDAQRRVTEAEASLTCAEVGIIKASFEAARSAVAVAPADDELARRLALVGAEVAERELAASAAGVVHRLAGPDDRDGLADYASQPPEVRTRVRELTRTASLDDLEHLLDRRSSVREAVDALLAYRAATSAELRPREALQLLAAHERVLAGFGAASRLAGQLRQRVREGRRDELLERLREARAALDAGDAAAALERLGKESFHDLDPADRDAAEALRAAAQRVLATRELAATYERLLRDGPALAACQVADQLLARADEVERPQRELQVAAAREAARREFGVWVSREDDAREAIGEARQIIELGAPLELAGSGEEPLPWLDADGQSLVVIESCDRWLFLEDLDLSRGQVRARIVVQTPIRLDTVATTRCPVGNVVIGSDHGSVLVLSRETWQPLSWRTIGPGKRLDQLELAPDGRHVWVDARMGNDRLDNRVEVVDLERPRAVRTISEGWWVRPLFGLGEPLMAHARYEGDLSLYYPGGAAARGGNFEIPATIGAVLVHPGQRRLLAFVIADDEDGEELGLVEIDAAGRCSEPCWLDDVNPSPAWVCATSLAQGTSFLAAQGEDAIWLHALSQRGVLSPIETRYRVRLSRVVSLAHDLASQHVVALLPDREQLHVVPLGRETPKFPESTPTPRKAVGLTCYCSSPPMQDELLGPIEEIAAMSEQVARAWMERQISEAGDDSTRLAHAWFTLDLAEQTTVAGALLGWFAERHPSDPNLALLAMDSLIRERRWDEVRRRVEALDLRRVAEERRRHALHLLGLALLHEGHVERACAAFEEGLTLGPDGCHLAMLLAVFGSRPSGDDNVTTLRELQAAIAQADDRTRCGDRAGVRAAIDREVVWSSGEVQSLARLAQLELGGEPDDDAGKFRKALALARFLDAYREDFPFWRELPVPGASWGQSRLNELDARAQAWLDRLGDRTPRRSAAPAGQDPSAMSHATGDPPAPSPEDLAPVETPRITTVESPMSPLPAGEAADQSGLTPGSGMETSLSAETGECRSDIIPTSPLAAPAEVSTPAWTLALRELDDAVAALASESPRSPGRLAFRIRHDGRRFAGIDVLLQKSLRNGRFSAGQIADASELLAAPESLTDDADAAAVVAITEGALQTTRTRPSPSRARTLRLLDAVVGHPRVFLPERPSEAVAVRRGELAVELVPTAEGLELRFRLLDGSDAVGRMSAPELVELVRRGAPGEDAPEVDEEAEDAPEPGEDDASPGP